MDIEVQANTDAGELKEALADWAEDKAAVVVAEINADIAILDGSPTNAQVIAVIRNNAVRERKIINGIVKLVKHNGI